MLWSSLPEILLSSDCRRPVYTPNDSIPSLTDFLVQQIWVEMVVVYEEYDRF